MRRAFFHPLAPLIGYTLMTALAHSAYVALRTAPPDGAMYIESIGWFYGVIVWMVADARRRRRLPCFDFGLLAIWSFPISLIWYCLWSRGWRGVLMLGALLGLYLVKDVFAVLVWIIVRVLE